MQTTQSPQTPQQHLITAVRKAGGQSKLASTMIEVGYRVTQQTLSNWLKKPEGPPSDAVPAICRAVKNQVKPHQLRPDVFPAPQEETAA